MDNKACKRRIGLDNKACITSQRYFTGFINRHMIKCMHTESHDMDQGQNSCDMEEGDGNVRMSKEAVREEKKSQERLTRGTISGIKFR